MSGFTGPHIAEFHLFSRRGKHLLFNVETMLFYEVTPVVVDLISLLDRRSTSSPDPITLLQNRYSEEEIQQAVFYLRQENFICPKTAPAPRLIKRVGIRHLELMVTNDCNMRCRYCYGCDDHGNSERPSYLYGSRTRSMPFATAKQGVDFLLTASGPCKELSVIFFGGEPLLEQNLLERISRYIRGREQESGKKIRLSLATNGLLLSEKTVSFLVRNNISCQVSLDGPAEVQDGNRVTGNGHGTYSAVLPGIQRLMKSRPGKVPVRATLCHSSLELLETIRHLHGLGFGSVHVEPVIGSPDGIRITAEDVAVINSQHQAITDYLVQCAEEDRYFNYTNLVRFIRHTTVVKERQAYYCGAGRTYLALSGDGAFYPCHRFVGNRQFQMGDIGTGFDDSLQQTILDLGVDERPICRTCWARYFCGGGCWHNNVVANGSLASPDSEVGCRITRHLIECAMSVSSELQELAKEKLSDMYESSAEPYLVAERQQEGGT